MLVGEDIAIGAPDAGARERTAPDDAEDTPAAGIDTPRPAAPPAPARRLTARLDDIQTWLFALPVVILGVGAWNHRWMADDALITLRVVDMSLHGHLLAFNPGERVEAATSPLWALILIVGRVTVGWLVDIAWVAVLAGLALTLAGLVAGVGASAALVRHGERNDERSVLFPAGALVLAALPPMWDFATSGLETGLVFGWIGACQWLIARRVVGDADRSPLDPWWVPVVFGLGPLIRPDLAVFSIGFLAAHLVLGRATRRLAVRTVAMAAALPLAYELFRMAYFASLVPNPALEKEASLPNVSKGIAYLDNLMSPYFLWIPLTLLVVWAASWLLGMPEATKRRVVLAVAIPTLTALAHGAYIIRVGGDFMHARLLLPALFGALVPIAVLPLSRARVGPAASVCAAGLVVWALVCATELRLPDDVALTPPPYWADVMDERLTWASMTPKRNAVTVDDFGGGFTQRAEQAKQLAAEGKDALVLMNGDVVRLEPGSGVVLEADMLGAVSVAAGPDVKVHDLVGLADPIGGRITVDRGLRIGHQKGGAYSRPWELARLSLSPGAIEAADNRARDTAAQANDGRQPDLPVPDPVALMAARVAVRCPAIRDLVAATTAPLTPARILTNIVQAPRLTMMRIPRDPQIAASCRTIR